jgi:hypothetical protein
MAVYINAIIFGSTGMVGEGVLHQALLHPDVKSVLVINRRPCNIVHPKLKEIIHDDFYNYTDIEAEITGYNACFFCLGVSSVGMKEKDYYPVTYNLTMQAAQVLARLSQDMTFCYVSGFGTDSSEKGKLMWARVKGKTENDLMKLTFKSAFMFRPGMIKPIKGLKNTYTIYKILNPVIPFLMRLFPKAICTLEDLGNAMVQSVINGYSKKIIENEDIAVLAKMERGEEV